MIVVDRNRMSEQACRRSTGAAIACARGDLDLDLDLDLGRGAPRILLLIGPWA